MSLDVIKNKIIDEYWLSKIENLDTVISQREKTSRTDSICLKSIEIAYFNQVTKKNTLAVHTILVAVYSMLLKKYFPDFDGKMHACIESKNWLPKSLLYIFNIDNIDVKTYINTVKKEIQESLSHVDYNEEVLEGKINSKSIFSCFSPFGITCNEFSSRYNGGISLQYELLNDGDITFRFEYIKSFVQAEVVGHLQNNLSLILKDLELFMHQDINDLEILSDVDKKELLEDFNNTKVDYPSYKTMIDFFEEQVMKTPDANAVLFGETKLSYKELNEKSNQLATYLRETYGIEADDMVGVLLKRSDWMLITILGVLKSGGAYVPIDPDYPKDRIEYIRKDTNCKVIIDDQEVEKIKKELVSYSSDNLNRINTSKNLAYVIYTSGTTGQPKGVMIEHSSLVNRLLWMQKVYPTDESDTLIQKTTYSFDVSVWELLWWFVNGAQLSIPILGAEKDPNLLLQTIEKDCVTVIHFVPSMLSVFLDYIRQNPEEKQSLSSLKQVFVSGEALKVAQRDLFYECLPNVSLMNLYGPTEAAIDVSFFDCAQKTSINAISIGKPIDNTQLYILTDELKLTPVGVVGSLYIAGVGLSRGYVNKPELTAKKFIDNPFNEGEKMYETGDLARWLPDGNIEFLGRKDFQVKLRGYRIELGAVEAHIQKYSTAIKQVVAVLKEINGEKGLVAYCTVSNNSIIELDLKEYLNLVMPDYMVPSLFVFLEEMPLTTNGKINRKALPEPLFEESIDYVAPNTELEHILAEVWDSLLDYSPIGVEDNFFELGGHSLLAIRMLSAIKKRLGVNVSITDIFDNPTIAALSIRIVEIGKGELLPEVSVMERPLKIPLSFSQERLWFIDKLRGSSHYHLPVTLKLKGAIHIDYLEKSLRSILKRHEILRTVYLEEEGVAYQEVLSVDNWSMSYETLDTGLSEYISNGVHEPFDLSTDYMLRARLFKHTEDEFTLVIVRHHIASDGWSASILVNEFKELYVNFLNEEDLELPELPFQYADYALWQRRYITDEYIEEKLSYWENALLNITPLQLPADFKRGVGITSSGSNISFTLPKKTSNRLKKYAQQEESTLFMVLLGIFKVLLYRYSGQTDICVGTTVANRPQKNLEHLIGFFVNTLALRSDMSGNPSFEGLLRAIKATTLEAYENISVPFEKVVDRVEKNRDHGLSSLFQVLFVLNNNPDSKIEGFDNVDIERLEMEYNIAKFDLTIFAEESEKGIEFIINYKDDLFLPATISRMQTHYEQLIHAVIENPLCKIGHLPMLSNEEVSSLLVQGSSEIIARPATTLIEMLKKHLPISQEILAIVEGETYISYKELDKLSDRLAYCLQENYSVSIGDLVGVMMDTSIWSVVGILGILKCGGAYVPIDSSLPEERKSFIISDTGLKLLLIDSEGLFEVANFSIPAFSVDIQLDGLEQPEYVDYPIINEDTIAYVIYTSGTTGNPKGVQISHGNLVDYYLGLDNELDLASHKSFGLMSSLSSDLGNTVVFGALLSGGSLHVFRKEQLMDGYYLLKYFGNNSIDCIKIVPSHWKALNSDDKLLVPKKTLIFGGDVLPVSIVSHIQNLHPEVQIVNHYGPTECTIGKLLHKIEEVSKYDTIPLGIHFGNTQVYIVSNDQSLSPIGVPGELLISGAGVSPGYLNRSELTKERFVKNPFGEGLVYKTGDLVKRNSEGFIEFIGRIDDQIKIRGYRVELKEVSKTIINNEAVKECEVVFKEGNLIAYVVVEVEYNESQIQHFLEAQLPDYMIPSLFVVLEEMPLTSNGKIDRKALPDPLLEDKQKYVTPSTEMEHILVDIWSLLLERTSIGIEDNFFELGGHSLLAIRVLSAVKSKLGVNISITDIFDYPTISSLSLRISELGDGGLLPEVTSMDRPYRIPLSFSQERLWFLDNLSGSSHYHLPVTLKLKGKVNLDYLEKSLRSILQRHEILRTIYLEEEGVAYQEVLPLDNWFMSFEDSDEGLSEYMSKGIHQPFDLSSDYMLRARLFKNSEEEFTLVMVRHHIASDGWSVSILVREFKELYANCISTGVAGLSELPFQYADYALWQRKHFTDVYVEDKLSYWENTLSGVTPLQLPTDFKRSGTASASGSNLSFNLSKEVSQRLKAYAQSEGCTLFMVLLSVYKVLLYRYSGQLDICVGTTVANRPQKNLEDLIGFFVNTLALRSDLSGDPSFEELLRSVKSTTLGAYEHISVPFEKVVDRVEKNRNKSVSSLFQVLFVLNNNPTSKIEEFSGIEIERLESDYDIAKFDLTIFAEDNGEEIELTINYKNDLFLSSTIARMQVHYEQLVNAVLENPSDKISSLPILSESETSFLLEQGVSKLDEVSSTSGATVLDIFKKHLPNSKDQFAVTDGGLSMKYNELEELSDKLSVHLQDAYGVGAGDLVGIMMDTSIWSILGILSVLKCGAGYVPIDASLPEDRKSFIISDTKLKLLLIDSEGLFEVTNFSTPAFSIDIQLDSLPIPETINYPIITKDTVAYVIYTSGTTGNPKGVQITHGNLVDYYNGLDSELTVAAEKTFGLMSSLSSDLGNTVVYGSLLSGGCLHVFKKEQLMDGHFLQNYFRNNVIDCIKIVPSHWKALAVEQDILVPAKTIIFGGDVLPVSTVAQIQELYPEIRIINHYGPTECTIGKLIHKVDLASSYKNIPLGTNFGNSQVYIVNQELSLNPIGVPGELLIGGAGVSSGYLNLEDTTSEKFIESPFGEGVLYRTGDLVKRNSDGLIEFMGRIDDQVKIRGYRVELKEISRTIVNHSTIKECEVLFKEDTSGIKRLVAYVTEGNNYQEEVLKEYILSVLPDYMIPSLFVLLDEMPLTSNGKIDRKSLPDPSYTIVKDYQEPVTDTEKSIVTIWEDLLGVDNVGITDNFFELGGDSIIVIQVVSRSKKKGLQIQVQDLFDYQTIKELAAIVDERSNDTNNAEQGILIGEVPISPIQQWFLNKEGGKLSYFNQSVLLKINKLVTGNDVKNAFNSIVKRHDSLRFSYKKEEEGWKQYYDIAKETFATVTVSESENITEEITALCEEFQKSLDIEKGELVKVVLIKTPKSNVKNRLFIVMHHLAVDGVSWRFIIDDLETLLDPKASINEDILLQSKSSSFRSWITQLNEFTKTEEIESQLMYWKNIKSLHTNLNRDFETDEKVTRRTIKTKEVILDEVYTKNLLQNVNTTYNTEINDILISALVVSISKNLNQEYITLGYEGHGRENLFSEIDLAGTTGWFTNKFPLQLLCANDINEGNMIKYVKETIRSVPLKGIGYGCLKYLHPSNEIRNSLEGTHWNIVFNYLGQVDNVINQSKYFEVATEYMGEQIDPSFEWTEEFVIRAIIESGQLKICWDYSEKHFKDTTVTAIAEEYIQSLQLLIDHCLQKEDQEVTPSDFGLTEELDYQEFDELFEKEVEGALKF